jgi:hypothetical protein
MPFLRIKHAIPPSSRRRNAKRAAREPAELQAAYRSNDRCQIAVPDTLRNLPFRWMAGEQDADQYLLSTAAVFRSLLQTFRLSTI